MQGNIKKGVLTLVWVWFASFLLASPLQAQPLFQNNNLSCEDTALNFNTFVIDPFPVFFALDTTVACGAFNDDSALGQADFPDCGTIFNMAPPTTAVANPLTNSLFFNTGAHGQNCVNAGEPNNQFQTPTTLQNQSLYDTDAPSVMGSIVSGNLNNGAFDDLAMVLVQPAVNPLNDSRSVQSLFSDPAGGFGSGLVTSDTVSELGAGPNSAFLPFPISSMFVGNNFDSERSLVLFDCDGDGVDEAAVAVRDQDTIPQSPSFIILQNNGSGLLDASPAGLFNLPLAPGGSTGEWNLSLASGDFNGDSNLDVGVALNQENAGADAIYVCIGNGSCGFSCSPTTADPNTLVLSGDPEPISIAAGDFNGDGLDDLVTAELNTFAGQVRILFSNGGDLTSWTAFTRSILTGSNTVAVPYRVTSGQFSTPAIQNGVDEILVSNIQGTGGAGIPTSLVAVVFPSSGGGAINSPQALTSDLGLPSAISLGIEAQDFDHCGGDDVFSIYATATPGNPPVILDHSSLFLNINEAPEVTIDSATETSGAVGQDLNIVADCTDPTFDDRTLTWTATGPAGATITFNPTSSTLVDPETQGNTAFSADQDGDYVITVTCTDFCGLIDTATVTVSLSLGTQGGCLANRMVGDQVDGKWVWGVFLMLPLFLILRRLGKKAAVISMVLLSVFFGAASSHALTQSFSVNTFTPTVDDSEYFTVYGSPTMLKRNFHAGFYLDYASDVYEFGSSGFNRVSGIVDHLLTGNLVGSYGVMDWLTVGVVVPVYFWEGVRSPVLALNQNNFELGDVQLVLKFRLVDREKHGFGVSIVPYMSFPSSTNPSAFLGEGSFNGGAKVVIDGRIKDRVSLALNVGFVTQTGITDIGGNNLDDQFLASLGISVDILKEKLKVIAEGQVATVAKDFFGSRRTTPAEARLGFRYTFAHNHDINAGAGFGLSNGIGSPQWRGFIGYTYTKRPIADVTEPPPPISDINVGDELTLSDKIYFEFDKAVIRDISKPTLDKIAGFLKAHPEVTKIRIDGYTCDLGSVGYNQRLSVRRAQAVAKYLEGQGISPDRIGTVEGFGENKPLVPNTSEANREQNRRVQIFVEAMAQPPAAQQ